MMGQQKSQSFYQLVDHDFIGVGWKTKPCRNCVELINTTICLHVNQVNVLTVIQARQFPPCRRCPPPGWRGLSGRKPPRRKIRSAGACWVWRRNSRRQPRRLPAGWSCCLLELSVKYSPAWSTMTGRMAGRWLPWTSGFSSIPALSR